MAVSDVTRNAARLGYLIGLGKNGPQISVEMDMTPGAVFSHAREYGLSFREAKAARRGNEAFEKALGIAAKKRESTPEEIIDRLLDILGNEPNLIDNILDDEHDDRGERIACL